LLGAEEQKHVSPCWASFQRQRHLYWCFSFDVPQWAIEGSDGGDIRKQEKAEREWEESLW